MNCVRDFITGERSNYSVGSEVKTDLATDLLETIQHMEVKWFESKERL